METLKQTAFVLYLNMRALPQRAGSSFVIVVGIAGVVAVLISVLSMATGLVATLDSSAREDRVVVVRNGASDETSSMLTRDQVTTATESPEVRRNENGDPVASAEVIVVVSLPLLGSQEEAQVSIRGVGEQYGAVRPEMQITSGRAFESGLNELVVGEAASARFAGLTVGSRIDIAGQEWAIVGTFTGLSVHDSALFTDASTLLSAFNRTEFQSVTALLDSPAALDAYEQSLRGNANLAVEVFSEREFFAEQSQTLNTVLKYAAYIVGGIMAFGAIFAALNVMYSAVSARSVEIATLRGIGYGPDAMVMAIMIEVLALGLIGGLVGAGLAWVAFNGYELSTLSGSGSQIVFELAVTAGVSLIGVVWACAIGLVGGMLPALKAAQVPVVDAIRSR